VTPGIRGPLTRLLLRLNLRFPALFLLLFALTLLDLLVPDVLPFLDEIVLALLTTILGLWKDRRGRAGAAVDDVRRN
jgi:hypothetical protein